MFVWLLSFVLLSAEYNPKGSVLLAGGGGTTPQLISSFVKAAGGADELIIIMPQTEFDPITGAPESIDLWCKNGAHNLKATVGMTDKQTIELLSKAHGVWIPGGDQTRFIKTFPETSGVPQAIRNVYLRGGIVGGTSAGCSLMGSLMPTGDKGAVGNHTESYTTTQGLKLIPNCLIDQHFFARERLHRLVCMVWDNPKVTGIGIDQSAWGIVHDGKLTMGEGSALLLQPVKTKNAYEAKMTIISKGYSIRL